MKRMKKCLSLILVLCMSTFGLPAFAVVAPTAAKTVLSDEALAQAVGGNYEARILQGWNRPDGRDVKVTAWFAAVGQPDYYSFWRINQCQGTYVFEVLDVSGNVVQTLATGAVPAQGQPVIVNATVSGANNNNQSTLRARAYCANGPWMEAVATQRRI